jgi:hypothetical protein
VSTGLGSSQFRAARRSVASAWSRSAGNCASRSPIKKQVQVLRRETPHGPRCLQLSRHPMASVMLPAPLRSVARVLLARLGPRPR